MMSVQSNTYLNSCLTVMHWLTAETWRPFILHTPSVRNILPFEHDEVILNTCTMTSDFLSKLTLVTLLKILVFNAFLTFL